MIHGVRNYSINDCDVGYTTFCFVNVRRNNDPHDLAHVPLAAEIVDCETCRANMTALILAGTLQLSAIRVIEA